MNLINQAVLTQLRKQATTVLTDTCIIEKELVTTGAAGQRIRSWQTVAQDIPCRIIQLGQQTQSEIETVSSRESMSNEYRLIVSATTELGIDYRVTIDGVGFQIVSLETELTDRFFRHAIAVQRL